MNVQELIEILDSVLLQNDAYSEKSIINACSAGSKPTSGWERGIKCPTSMQRAGSFSPDIIHCSLEG